MKKSEQNVGCIYLTVLVSNELKGFLCLFAYFGLFVAWFKHANLLILVCTAFSIVMLKPIRFACAIKHIHILVRLLFVYSLLCSW